MTEGYFCTCSVWRQRGPRSQPDCQQEEQREEEGVSTNEDLMREHGVLKRLLLLHEEIIRRIQAKQDFPLQTVTDVATIIRKFIEDYHEKLEEDHLFPRF